MVLLTQRPEALSRSCDYNLGGSAYAAPKPPAVRLSRSTRPAARPQKHCATMDLTAQAPNSGCLRETLDNRPEPRDTGSVIARYGSVHGRQAAWIIPTLLFCLLIAPALVLGEHQLPGHSLSAFRHLRRCPSRCASSVFGARNPDSSHAAVTLPRHPSVPAPPAPPPPDPDPAPAARGTETAAPPAPCSG
jgi:hypothetical protein